jgi:hypothetical protein
MKKVFYVLATLFAMAVTSCNSQKMQLISIPTSAEEMVQLYLNSNTEGWDISTSIDTTYWNIWRQDPGNASVGIGIASGGGKAWELTTATVDGFKLLHIQREWSSGETRDLYVAVNTSSTLVTVTTPSCAGGAVTTQTFSVYSDAYAINDSSTGINNGEYVLPQADETGCVYSEIFYGNGTNIVPFDQQIPTILLVNVENAATPQDGRIRTFLMNVQ